MLHKDYYPFNMFVYADKAAKLQRCMEHAKEGEILTLGEIERNMRTVDKNRARHRDFYTDSKWGANETFHLCVNMSGMEIKKLVPVLAEYIKLWFEIRNT